jgi:hypothetical protein
MLGLQLLNGLIDCLRKHPFAKAVFGFPGDELDNLKTNGHGFWDAKVQAHPVPFEIRTPGCPYPLSTRKPFPQNVAAIRHPSPLLLRRADSPIKGKGE